MSRAQKIICYLASIAIHPSYLLQLISIVYGACAFPLNTAPIHSLRGLLPNARVYLLPSCWCNEGNMTSHNKAGLPFFLLSLSLSPRYGREYDTVDAWSKTEVKIPEVVLTLLQSRVFL
jgi:hypothetical protein